MATQSRIMPVVAFGTGIAVMGFTIGATIASVSGESVWSTGGLFAISAVAQTSLMHIAERYVKSADSKILSKETFAQLKADCALRAGIIGGTVAVGGYFSGLMGPAGAMLEATKTAWLCYTIPESLEAAREVQIWEVT